MRDSRPNTTGPSENLGRTHVPLRDLLVVVHDVAAGKRLQDAIAEVECLADVQVAFTRPPDTATNGVDDFLHDTAGLVVPWHSATRRRFDAIVSARPASIGPLDGSVLLLPNLPEDGTFTDPCGTNDAAAWRQVMARPAPVTVGVPHKRHIEQIRHQVPEAAAHAVVVGDRSFDRMVESTQWRDSYRAHLKVGPDTRLGLVLSSHGPCSLYGRSMGLMTRLAVTMQGAGQRLFCQLHPNVWTSHGRRQVMAWAREATRVGLTFVEPDVNWCIPLAAADYIIGDHGTLTAYAAALGRPVYLAHSLEKPRPGSTTEMLAEITPVLDPARSLPAQLGPKPADGAELARRITSVPGQSAGLIRSALLRLLDLTRLAA